MTGSARKSRPVPCTWRGGRGSKESSECDGQCHDHHPRTTRSTTLSSTVSETPFLSLSPSSSPSQTALTRRRRALLQNTTTNGLQALTMENSPPAATNDADQEPQTFDPRTAFAPFLQCLACDPPGLLVAPTTLHCGHTVCAHHVRSPADGQDDGHEHGEQPSASSSRLQLPTTLARILSNNPTQQHIPPPPTQQPPDPANANGQLLVMPTCPIPNCRQAFASGNHNSTRINIPPNSTVAYYPPMQQQQLAHDLLQQRVTIPEPRIDVSVSRVLGLLERTEPWVSDAENETDVVRVRGDEVHESGDESDEDERGDNLDEETSLPSTDSQGHAGPSSLRRRRPSSPSDAQDNVRSCSGRSPRPRKRPRRQSVTKDPDSLSNSHFTARTAHRPRSPGSLDHTPPRTREGAEERFNKELTEQLSCEICFILLYEPVTTPCQHVRKIILIPLGSNRIIF